MGIEKIDLTMEETENNLNDLLVAIVYYNGGLSAVNNIRELSKNSFSILVVDNGSDSKNAALLSDLNNNSNLTLITNKMNKGIGFALNQALQYAFDKHIKYLLTLDQDTKISQEVIIRMLKKIRLDNYSSVGPYYGKKVRDIDTSVTYLITSGNIINVDIAKKLGGFEDKLFIDCVDLDFSFKQLINGYKMVKVGGAIIQHNIGELKLDSPLKVAYYGHNPKRYYYNFRNNVYIYRKYFFKLPLPCIKLFLSLCFQELKIIILEGQKNEKIKYTLKGINDGIKMKLK